MGDGRQSFIGTAAESRDYAPFLRWLLVMGLVVLALGGLWYFGFLRTILASDHTRISLLIFALFVLTSLHCLGQTLWVSRELITARKVRDLVLKEGSTGYSLDGNVVRTGSGAVLPPGLMTSHIAHLARKAELRGAGRLDQTLLLRSVADRLRAREKLGLFISEALLRLALLGTAIGFILMLIPISGLTSFEEDTLRQALAGMTGGMAVALNVTVSGIATALVLKFEYFQLDAAIGELFALVSETSEIHVVPVIERGQDGRA